MENIEMQLWKLDINLTPWHCQIYTVTLGLFYLFVWKMMVLSHVILSVIATACTRCYELDPLWAGVSSQFSLCYGKSLPQEMFINCDQVS